MKKIIFILIVLLTGVFFSCYDDKSKTPGREIAEVTITTESDTLTAVFGKEFVVRPDIKKGEIEISDANFSYLWQIAIRAGWTSDLVDISEEKDLVYTMTSEPNNSPYFLVLKVTDNDEGVSYYKYWYVYVTSSFGEGLLVAHTSDGGVTSDLTYVKSPEVSYDYKGEVDYARNIYSVANDGEKIDGKVNCLIANVGAYGTVDSKNRILLGTDKHLLALNALDFSRSMDESELFYAPPANCHIISVGNLSSQCAYVLIDGMLHGQMCLNVYQFGAAVNYNVVSSQRFSSKLAVKKINGGNVNHMTNYDEEHGYFLEVSQMAFISPMMSSSILTQQLPDGMHAFNPGKLPDKQVLAAGVGASGEKHWHLLRDKTSNLDTIFQIESVVTDDSDPEWPVRTTGGTAKIGMSHCSDFAHAVAYAFCENTDVVYYATANKIYPVVLSGNTAVEGAVWNLTADGEKITAIQIYQQAWYGVQANDPESFPFISPEHNRELLVTTYNASSREGKIYVLPIESLGSGRLGDAVRVFDGFGEITAICSTLR